MEQRKEKLLKPAMEFRNDDEILYESVQDEDSVSGEEIRQRSAPLQQFSGPWKIFAEKQ
ncbi:hypothetical protein [Faecalibaculum rodentium]|uniref:hypothetical protein n=1 Tax=Faecalibaculum rodentium TaxID=1702221 RepID=UPI003F665819